ncbi:hypothetical protein L1987_17200 [Smallanthus sonchifolius]|uniref:Uncharacterized protein n=1 Tax=Smallanthus sonchifolius TaxID=185202 RepID=A0ACB9IWV3_9ASTR|nr:hypothetical protein L1987_17200 [Smallanthus sonchifolius]
MVSSPSHGCVEKKHRWLTNKKVRLSLRLKMCSDRRLFMDLLKSYGPKAGGWISRIKGGLKLLRYTGRNFFVFQIWVL